MDKSFSTSGPKLEKIQNYVTHVFAPEDPLLAEIRERSAREGLPQIHVGPMDGLHLEVLVRASGARKAVEIGTLAGYSGVRIVRGLGPGGKLWTFEFEPVHAAVAAETFKRAGIHEKVEIRVGTAIDEVRSIENQGLFDVVFVDADKVNYPAYAEWAAQHLRVGGLLIGDNSLAWGMIADETFESEEDRDAVRGLRAFNDFVARSGRFKATLMPTGEGLTVAVKL